MTTFRCDDAVAAIGDDPDAASRGRRATEMINHLQCMIRSLAAIRGEAILALYEQGILPKDIAADIGLSKGRVSQIVQWFENRNEEDPYGS